MGEYLLSVDPGTEAIGVAVWGDIRYTPENRVMRTLIEGLVIRPQSMKWAWHDKVLSMTQQLEEFVGDFNFHILAIEWPHIMGGARGMAANQGGTLLKLAYSVGAIAQWCQSRRRCDVLVCPVFQWKGQLPKSVVAKRIRKRLTASEIAVLSGNESHDWDACGIGLYQQGRFG